MIYIRLHIKNKELIVRLVDNPIDNDRSLYYDEKNFAQKKEEIINIIKTNNINKIVYEEEKAFYYLNNMVDVEKNVFYYEKSLSINILNSLLKKEHLKSIECYFMPSDYADKFKNKNVSVRFNNKYLFTIDFVVYNGLNNLKDVYYKKSIDFYSKKDIRDNLKYFLNINKNIEVINLYYYSKESITYIEKVLKENNIDNIKILIHLSSDNNLIIGKDKKYLKKLNKENDNIIKIVYSEEYFDDNILNSFCKNIIKVSVIGMLYVGLVLIFSNAYHEYSAALELRKLETTLIDNSVAEVREIDQIDDISNSIIENNETENSEEENSEEENSTIVDPYSVITFDFNKLNDINSDTVAWLNVKNTNINYPVMQTTNNSYYLSHDIFESYSPTGWIFMDYRVNNRSRNTIIYGHAALSGIMFGTLYYLTSSYYTNSDDNKITLSTADETKEYKVFSIYKVEETSDYLRVNFNSDEDFLNYLNMVKSRSISDFNIDVNEKDNILTLSTCSGNNRRLVVHAKEM